MSTTTRVARRAAIIAAALLVLTAASVAAINPSHLNRVTFTNDTGYDIHYLFFSPADSETWGADILGSDRVFPAGDTISFYIHYPDQSNDFDLLAVDEEGDAYRRGATITDGTEATIAITMDDYRGAYLMPQLVEIELVNDTGYDIHYLFVSPSDSRMWGVDLLGDQAVFVDGGRFASMVQLATSPLSVDVQGVDEERDVYQFSVYMDQHDDTVTRTVTLTDIR